MLYLSASKNVDTFYEKIVYKVDIITSKYFFFQISSKWFNQGTHTENLQVVA